MMEDFWKDFFACRDPAHLIAASVAGAVAYLSISMLAIVDHNLLALVLNLIGAGSADVAYRLTSVARLKPLALSFVIASWVFPVAAVALLVFFPPPLPLPTRFGIGVK